MQIFQRITLNNGRVYENNSNNKDDMLIFISVRDTDAFASIST